MVSREQSERSESNVHELKTYTDAPAPSKVSDPFHFAYSEQHLSEMVTAATKIQAIIRGRLVRRSTDKARRLRRIEFRRPRAGWQERVVEIVAEDFI